MYSNVVLFSFFRRFHLAIVALVVAVGLNPLDAQSLRFAPVLYGIESVNGTQANNVNALSGPNAIAVDPVGNLFIIDIGHQQIRKVDPTGTASLYAGKGVASYTGDNGPAINATFYSPQAIASDALGNIYVADGGNFAIRRIDAVTGIITTIAGGNGAGYTGDGFAATAAKLQGPTGLAFDSAGNLYVSDGAVVRRIDTSNIIMTFAGGGTPASGNGDGGVATSAKLISPIGLAVDVANNLYIVDGGAYQVRVVHITNNNITTFAGTGVRSNTGDGGLATAATFLNPRGVALDGAGNVFIADVYGYIRVINSSNIISTLAGNANGTTIIGDGTLPTQASIAPNSIASDTSGNVYFPVASTNKVYKIVTHPERFPMTQVGLSSPSQRIILENVGTTTITYTNMTVTGDFAVVAPNPYLSDSSPCYPGTGSRDVDAGFNNYCELDISFTPTASGIRAFPVTVTSNDTPSALTLTLTSTGMASTLTATGGDIFTIAGNYPTTGVYGDGNLATASTLVQPDGLAIDSTGNIYFSEYGYCRIRKIDAATGILTTIAGINPTNCNQNAASNQPDGPAAMAELYLPSAIALDANGNLYVSDGGHDQIRVITPGGQIVRIAGTGLQGCTFTGDGGPAIDAQFCDAGGIAVDKAGNVYFTDNGAHMIRKITASTGLISVLAGTFNPTFVGSYSPDGLGTSMTLNRPWGIALDSTQTNLIFVENGSNIVRKLNLATDMITTIAGNHSVIGYSGDGGLATAATLNDPNGLTVDAANDIFIADSENNVVRKIDGSTGIITTVAGNFVQGGLYNGDGIPATSAGLNFPENVAVDAAGYLILSDRNPLIREVSPNGSLVFGNQLVSTTSASQTVTISNIGNTPMTFNSPAYGISGDFALVSGGTCDFTTMSTLTPGTSCTVKVNFTPAATGARYGLLAYYDNGVASPQMTQLRGVGTAPVQLAGQTISFSNPGTKTYGSSTFSVTATATSSLPVTITVQSGPATISNGIVTLTGAGTVVLVANQSGNAYYSAAPPVTASFTVSPAVLTVTPIPVSIVYGTAIPASFATSITGFVNSDPPTVVTGSATVKATATAGSPVASYTLTATLGTLSAANYTFTFAPGTFTITQAGTTIGITTTAAQINVLASDTFIATVTPLTSGIPTGTITFYDNGTTSIGSFAIVAGVADSFSTSALGGGVHTITAHYSGDTNFTASTSAPVTVTVGDYGFTASPSTFAIVDGKTGTTTITFTPSSGWTGTQTLACVGLKTGETCSFSPAIVTSSGNNAPSTIVLSISTTALTAATQSGPLSRTGNQPRFAFLLALLPLAFVIRRRRRMQSISLCLLVICVLLIQTGCGSGTPSATTNPNGTPTGTGTLSVTLPGADAAHQLTLNVTVN